MLLPDGRVTPERGAGTPGPVGCIGGLGGTVLWVPPLHA
jgi:hypothetical protein